MQFVTTFVHLYAYAIMIVFPSGFVQVLEGLESTWNSSLVFQGLEILEKQYFFGQGA